MDNRDVKAFVHAACPTPKTYTRVQLDKAADEMGGLGAGSQIREMMDDYDVLLRQSRDCQK